MKAQNIHAFHVPERKTNQYTLIAIRTNFPVLDGPTEPNQTEQTVRPVIHVCPQTRKPTTQFT